MIGRKTQTVTPEEIVLLGKCKSRGEFLDNYFKKYFRLFSSASKCLDRAQTMWSKREHHIKTLNSYKKLVCKNKVK